MRLTEKGLKYFFRTAPRDDEQGRMAAQTIGKPGFKKVAILHDSTVLRQGPGRRSQCPAEEERVRSGVLRCADSRASSDYTAILTKLKGASPDVVLFTGYYPEAGLLLRAEEGYELERAIHRRRRHQQR
ncbi:MAG: hypothetical protein MZU95_17225 [Desulfomicrobium escambiense]|nr:hypothetical protein [Desulfomicrobium escambiense]